MKPHHTRIAVLILAILFSLSCGLGAIAPDAGSEIDVTLPPQANGGNQARQHLEYLSQGIGARLPGSEEEARAADYIEETLMSFGYDVQRQVFQFRDEDGQAGRSANLIALKPGASGREIIVGAHYDSSDEGSGADDNASGVAVLLTLAEQLKDVDTPHTIRFIAFGAEENDLDGSRFYVDQLIGQEIDSIVGMINLDSLVAGDKLYVYADVNKNAEMQRLLLEEDYPGIDFIGMTLQDLNEEDGTACECADYDAFSNEGIAFAYLEATNWDLGDRDGLTQVDTDLGDEGAIIHTEYDTIQAIDDWFPGRIDQHLDFVITELFDLLTHY